MFAALLILSVLGAYVVIRLRFSILPESSVAILLGAAFGAVLRAFPEAQAHEWWSFQPEVFSYALLPPIIFEAGYTLKRRLFLANLSPILLFAVLGTVIATFALGGLLIGVSQLGWLQVEVTPGEAMVFGALISAVDPVATLSVLSSAEVNADPMLVSILFGESCSTTRSRSCSSKRSRSRPTECPTRPPTPSRWSAASPRCQSARRCSASPSPSSSRCCCATPSSTSRRCT